MSSNPLQIKVIVATHNKGKLQELEQALSSFPVTIVNLHAFPLLPEIEETGHTFEENALLKAKATTEYTGLISIADDSGLKVHALNGEPGIFSARYASNIPKKNGISNDQHNIEKLLTNLLDIPLEKRTATFYATIVAYKPNDTYIVTSGTVDGHITFEPKGLNGFGYDPIFIPIGATKTFGELSSEEKKFYSHRNKAIEKLSLLWPRFIL